MNKTLSLKVDNLTFLIERMGKDCRPLQFLRELTQNAIEAILRTPEKRGSVIWDCDDIYAEHGVYSLCVIDNGDGMTGDEMIKYLAHLSSSSSKQSLTGNYGVGAKITAAMQNPMGVLYLSWKNGKGHMIHLWKDPQTGEYGLKQYKRPDGTYGHYIELDDKAKPAAIKDHGTKVVLLGASEGDETIIPPANTPSPSFWVAYYLNSRYFEFPNEITVYAKESYKDKHFQRRKVTGMKYFLEARKEDSGQVDLNGTKAHWWILKEQDIAYEGSRFNDKGHVAALYQNELYDLHARNRRATRILQSFGIVFNHRRVVIYIEPQISNYEITTDTSRTRLKINGESLPWEEWAAEFREKMPMELQNLQEAVSSENSDHSKFIQERLKTMLDFLNISKYKHTPEGTVRANVTIPLSKVAINSEKKPRKKSENSEKISRKKSEDAIYSLFQKELEPVPAQPQPDVFGFLPETKWISIKNGSRELNDLEDRAARFLSEKNLLLINEDFRIFKDLVNAYIKLYKDRSGIKGVAEEAVRRWYSLCLTEIVLGVRSLQSSKEWTNDDIAAALSEEALTSAVMQRYHVNFAIKRDLGSSCGASDA